MQKNIRKECQFPPDVKSTLSNISVFDAILTNP